MVVQIPIIIGGVIGGIAVIVIGVAVGVNRKKDDIKNNAIKSALPEPLAALYETFFPPEKK